MSRSSGKSSNLLWSLVKGVATAAVWGVIAVILIFGFFFFDLPDVDEAFEATRRPTMTLLASDGAVIAAKGDLYGVPVGLDDIPEALPNAILATEDRRFYDHFGLDVIGLARATWANLKARRIVQGGSTITQQVAKNLFLTPERSIKRKVQELMLAFWLESRFSKEQILTIYLNRVYLGAGTYGVDAAARRYFGRSVSKISTYEAALLAGLLKAPSRYNPARSPKRARERTQQVLRNMVAAGYLTEAQAKAAAANRRKRFAGRSHRSARHFADWVLEQVPSYVSASDRDLVVVTTLDARLQRTAERKLENLLAKNGAKRRTGEGAVLVMDTRGAVTAMVGGRNYAESQFNRVTQARRQPGSAFKPFVFLAGLEAGLRPDSRIEDGPVEIGGWKPENFDRKFRGPVMLTHALAHSINTVAVRVADRAGAGRVADAARRLGIVSELKADLGLALGTAEVSLMELTAAYAPFANGGDAVWPFAILEIRDGTGAVLYRRSGGGPGVAVSRGYVGAMNTMMSETLANGTGKRAKLDREAAGKTGTSQNYRDAWFIGYTADRVAGVWLGNDDGGPMKGVTGGGAPAGLWRDVMAAAHKGIDRRPLPGRGTSLPDRPSAVSEQQPEKKKDFWSNFVSDLLGSDKQ